MDINMREIIEKNMKEQMQLLRRVMETDYADKMIEAAECILHAIQTGHKVLIAGNGGSAADAQHMAAELVVRFEKDREGYPAMALTTDSSILSAGGNDYGFEAVYERQIQALGAEDDIFIAISTSGNSENIVRAVHMAGDKKMKVIGMTGQTGGRMRELCDIVLCVPHDRTARIQEIHEHTIHTLCQLVEQKM
ncbi:MAG: D-sedoheptulose 7-phosphate isomerase [Lachnospiraceae bacterium]|nr:D-sedoheptulose 7-phosphate isomerase [Lachnospiraceae bacterium]